MKLIHVPYHIKISGLLLIVLFTLFVGTLAFHHIEGWNYVDSLYFCAITLSTVGYGDFAPKTDFGKLFTVVYLFIGIGIIFSFINVVAKREMSRLSRKHKK